MSKPSESGMESRIKTIFKASIVAIIVNVALGIFKAIVGMVSNSIAITMDAINNFTDAASSFITILSSHFASKNPDKKHPFGYGRMEYLGTLLIAGLILYAGITSFVESVKKIIHPEAADYSTISLIILVVAVLAKGALSLYTSKMGKKAKSDSLIASAKESVGDIAISAATIVAALIYIFTSFSIEAWLGAVIAALITKTGIEILKETVGKLLGEGAEASLVRDIKAAIKEHEGITGAYDLVLHNYGPDAYLASVHVEVEDTLPISGFDALSREIQNDIAERFGVYLSAVGVYSVNTKDADKIAMREEVQAIAQSVKHVTQMHGFYVDMQKKYMRFDLVISFESDAREKVYSEVVEKVSARYPDYAVSAGMDTDYNEL